MDTQTDLQLFTALQEAFDEEKECEHPYHSDPEQRPFHEGKAAWYSQVACLVCQRGSAVLAVCDKWLKDAEKLMTQCPHCLTVAPTYFLVKERIK